MKKINVLYTPIGNIGVGGLSTIAFKLASEIDSKKVEVDFFTISKIKEYYKKIAENKNGKIFEYDISKKKNIFSKKFFIIRNYCKTLKQNSYDIIHIHIDNSYNGFLYGIISKIFSRKSKIIFHSHNAAISGKIKNILHIFFKPFFSILGDEYCSCSTEAAKWMYPKKIVDRVEFIENGVNITDFIFNEDIRNNYRNNMNLNNDYVIGHIGRFVEQKNHEFLIDIFDKVHKKDSKTKLLLVGIGELQEKIKKKVYQLRN